jgi:methylmalonyl-CoA epimerase
MPKIKKIDHIGIVVADINEATCIYKNLLFKEPFHTEYFEATSVELAFFDMGGVHIELLTPKEPGSEIWTFLQEKGEGLHHICYEVDDLEGILKTLPNRGIKLIDETPRPGSRNSRIAFVDPESSGGVLTEYCEFPRV